MSFEEARLQGMTKEVFDEIDINGDGEITMDEFRAFHQKRTM